MLVGVPVTIALAISPVAARADDPLPTIVTYEMSKARSDALAAERDPKRFWAGEIVTRLEARKMASRLALKQPATVELSFVVDRAGHIVSQQVTHSSGDPAVDRQATAVLAAAEPFPPMPANIPDSQLAFSVPLRFR